MFSPLRNVILVAIFLTLTGLVLLLFAPLSLYLNFNSLLKPQALLINGVPVSWQQFKQAVNLVNLDKRLKTKQEKLQASIELAIERQLLKQAINERNNSSYLSLFDELQSLRSQIDNSVNWRTGGYFIARFKTPPQATESATVLEQKAKDEINKMRNQLNQGADTKILIKETNNNLTLLYLNQSAFIPGTYLEGITEDQFPLKIKNLRDAFFQIPAGTVSEVLTLSWDDYDGVSYGEKFSGKFAYAVIKVEQVNPGYFKDYNSWLDAQKQKAEITSFVFVPFFLHFFFNRY